MNDFIICATRSMHNYALRVVDGMLKFPGFSDIGEQINKVDLLSVEKFADGEMEVTVKSSIRGKDVFLFTSCSRNEAGIETDEAKIELYNAVDALKRSQASKIIVFEPFVSCSRSDRTNRRSSVGLCVHFKLLTSLGAEHIVTFQLHSDKSKSILDPSVCFLDDVPALTLLEKYLCDQYIHDIATLQSEVRTQWVFCSIDAGGEKLARTFANAFGAPLVIAHKQRNYSTANSIESINILSAQPIDGKVVWIVDDMIDTAGSADSLIKALHTHNPKEVNILAVHAVLSPPASARLSELRSNGFLNHIIVTDTVCTDTVSGEIEGLQIVQSAGLSARIVKVLTCNESLYKIMRVFNAEIYLQSPNLFSQ